ncbi:3-hydroxyacyl-CoA dehydrogenase family protein [Chloroflexota bacterium]
MKLDQIKKVAVVGAGLMGHGIAQAFAQGGFSVNVTDASASVLEVVKDRIRANLVTFVEEKFIGKNGAKEIPDRIYVFPDLGEAVHEANFVIEAISEDLEAKRRLFKELEKHCSPDTILASNTSSFRMTDIASDMKNPERAVITHWFNPPYLVPLVEVMPGEKTSAETCQITSDLLAKIKKVPVRVRKEIPGFLVNRIQTALYREIFSLLEMGVASAEDIDSAVKASLGFRLASIGPLLVRDLAGLGGFCKSQEALLKEINSSTELSKILKDKVARGDLGVETGKGFFKFNPESAAAIIKERDRQFVRRLKEFR